MLQSFVITLLAVLLGTATLVLARYRVEALEERRELQVQRDSLTLKTMELR
jgi:uncharacterized membrane protein